MVVCLLPPPSRGGTWAEHSHLWGSLTSVSPDSEGEPDLQGRTEWVLQRSGSFTKCFFVYIKYSVLKCQWATFIPNFWDLASTYMYELSVFFSGIIDFDFDSLKSKIKFWFIKFLNLINFQSWLFRYEEKSRDLTLEI